MTKAYRIKDACADLRERGASWVIYSSLSGSSDHQLYLDGRASILEPKGGPDAGYGATRQVTSMMVTVVMEGIVTTKITQGYKGCVAPCEISEKDVSKVRERLARVQKWAQKVGLYARPLTDAELVAFRNALEYGKWEQQF